MKLTISLSPTEQANIHGWVNKGLADPAFAAMPTRIVLEERNRARFDEIAKQFYAPIPVDPSTGPWGPPTNTAPWTYPLEFAPPMWGGKRRSGENGVPLFNTRAVTVVPIVVPASPTFYQEPTLAMGIAEYGTPACSKQVTLSRAAGDFSTALAYGQGTSSGASVEIGKQVLPGETIYFNVRFWSGNLNAPGTDDAMAGVTYSGGWPK